HEVRPRLVVEPDSGVLFLTKEGLDLTPDHLSGLVTRYVDKAELGKRGSCHLFRHTMATLMLEGGADLRYIQQMLGHADIATTTIYTQVAIGALKAIHDATHPGATNTPHRRVGPPHMDGPDTVTPHVATPHTATPPLEASAAALLAALDAEADDAEADEEEDLDD
ncbi:MAG: tyrosine-type recombinase/integrase, partial [Acidimicrobiales bacterium]